MKEFTKLIDAVAEASLITDEWVILPDKDHIGKKDALERALEIDKGNEEEGMAGRFVYLCSAVHCCSECTRSFWSHGWCQSVNIQC